MNASLRWFRPAPLLAALVAAAAFTSAAAPAAPKWHPGHYVFAGRSELKAEHIVPRFQGVERLYDWRALEPERGRYDFAAIRKDLAFLRGHGRHLVAQIQYKAFGKGRRATPDYLQGEEFGGGVYQTRTGSFDPVQWNPRVGERMDALFAALGREFDADPNFEAVVLPETSPSAPLFRETQSGVQPVTMAEYGAALAARLRACRAAFPRTVVIQYTNFPTDIIPALVACMQETGAGMGGPDVYPFESGLSAPGGVYSYYPRLSGVVPLGAAVQSPDYSVAAWKRTAAFNAGKDRATAKVDPADEVQIPPADMVRFAREKLHLSYLFWAASPKACFDTVARWLSSPEAPPDAAGGLDARLPQKALGAAPTAARR